MSAGLVVDLSGRPAPKEALAARADQRVCEGSVVIPAHDEAAVIARTLAGLAPLAAAGRLEVVVSCNGCTDATAEIARGFEGIVVVETEVPSKVAALNAADTVARCWPRLYLDADIELSSEGVRGLFCVLAANPATRAVRPALRYDTEGATFLVRSYYRARARSSATTPALWGAGAYALSRVGRDAFGQFPDLTADDVFVDRQFESAAKEVVATVAAVVRTPRTLEGLVAVLRRTYRGNQEFDQLIAGETLPRGRPGSTVRTLLTSTRTAVDLVDTAVYLGFAVLGRSVAARPAAAGSPVWERDHSSREARPSGRDLSPPSDSGECDHVLLTRFNLPSQGVESLIRAKDGWLAARIELFERYCVPSVLAQGSRNFSWIVYLDPASPQWLLGRLAPHVAAGTFTPVFREEVGREELLGDLRAVVGPDRRPQLITTNLDNDDGLAVDFVERLQAVRTPHPRAAVFLGRGLIRQGDSVYVRSDRHNAFCSVRESWDDAVTCWADWHNRLALQMPAVDVAGEPAWLQVVHETNVSNRVRGRLTSPRRHLAAFGALLSDVGEPRRSAVVRDWMSAGPRRLARETARTVVKRAIMAVGGPEGLDRIKLLGARRPR